MRPVRASSATIAPRNVAPGPDAPEAEHLRENIRAELFGTTDVQEAIEGAIPWNPPEGPTPEGVSGSDVTPEVMNDEH